MANRLFSWRFPADPGIRNVKRQGFSNQVGLILEPVARELGFTVIPRYARKAFANQARIAVFAGSVQVVDSLWLVRRVEWPIYACAARAVGHLREQLSGLNLVD